MDPEILSEAKLPGKLCDCGAYDAYVYTWTFASVLLSIPLGFMTLMGILSTNFYMLLFWGVPLVFLWVARLWLKKRRVAAYLLTLLPVTVLWTLLLLQTLRRVAFIVKNGGMDSYDEPGSPMAFLIGMVAEQSVFLPLSLVIVVGWSTFPLLIWRGVKIRAQKTELSSGSAAPK